MTLFENGARYLGIGPWLKKNFDMRISKVSIDGGFTCPNRDGTCGTGGCIFCSETGSGDFSGTRIIQNNSSDINIGYNLQNTHDKYEKHLKLRQTASIRTQMDVQISALKRKWTDFKCIAYFQNYTNTYASVEILKRKYLEALSHPDCIGIAIATRPDCLEDDVMELLDELNRKTFLWVELGLQSSNEMTARLINRGYPLSTYDLAVKKLNSLGIRIVTHLIAGLPTESKDDFLKSVRHVTSGDIFGIKLQLLHVIRNTVLADMWNSNQFKTLERHEYISAIADALEIIPPNVTIHRLTGDAPANDLLSPLWSTDKMSILNGIRHELKIRSSYQGSRL